MAEWRNAAAANWSRRLAIVPLALAALASHVPLCAAPDPPKVHVQFDQSRAPTFGMLTDDGQRALAAQLASTTAELWGFLDWRVDLAANDVADAEWVIRLEEEEQRIPHDDGTSTVDWKVRLEHYVRIGTGREWKLRQLGTKSLVYEVDSIKPSNPARLQLDLERKIGEQLDDAFMANTGEVFVGNVPLGEALVLDQAHDWVIVPLLVRELRASSETRLGVKFKSREAFSGSMELKTASPVPAGSANEGFVIGQINEFTLPGVIIATPTWWDDDLPEILDNATEVRILMIEYHPDPAAGIATESGSVLEPEPGGSL
jgi:hypothetical protein